jgi:uncharacterized integral membrane protein
MSRNGWIAVLLLLAVVVSLAGLFYVQNSARTTQLSFDLGFAAWQLTSAKPVPALLLGAAGGGFLLGFLPMWLRGFARARKIKQLERQLALQDGRGGDKPW